MINPDFDPHEFSVSDLKASIFFFFIRFSSCSVQTFLLVILVMECTLIRIWYITHFELFFFFFFKSQLVLFALSLSDFDHCTLLS